MRIKQFFYPYSYPSEDKSETITQIGIEWPKASQDSFMKISNENYYVSYKDILEQSEIKKNVTLRRDIIDFSKNKETIITYCVEGGN